MGTGGGGREGEGMMRCVTYYSWPSCFFKSLISNKRFSFWSLWISAACSISAFSFSFSSSFSSLSVLVSLCSWVLIISFKCVDTVRYFVYSCSVSLCAGGTLVKRRRADEPAGEEAEACADGGGRFVGGCDVTVLDGRDVTVAGM